MAPAKGNSLYQVTPGDLQIFEKVRRTGNLSWFTNYYLRREDSGTWWKPVIQDELDKIVVPEFMEMALRWRDGYEHLFKTWNELGKPGYFLEVEDHKYEVITAEQHDSIFDKRKYKTVYEFEYDRPVFHHNHGFILLPWAQEACLAPQEERVIIGGYGCIAGETRIYDAELKEHVAVADLVAQQRAPMVMSWNGDAFVPMRATIPFLKGRKELYRVTLRSGRSFVCTLDHALLTPFFGWQALENLSVGDAVRTQHLWGEIVSISYETTGDYYDLHVPVHNNYLAEGVVHHNSGKTLNFTAEALVHAAMLKSFRCFILAPYALQANEVYSKAKELIEGTLYEERFLIRAPRKPMNHLVIGNSLVGGENLIECYPILEDPGKIKNLSGDMALIDQAEMLPDIEEIRSFLGSRFRGQVGGRARLGKTAYIANVADNPALWDLYDEQETDPDSVYSFSPHSGLNFYLTIKDMIRYQKRVGKTAEERRMFFAGGRPLGSGQHFSQDALKKCRADWLDELMEQHLADQTPGWTMMKALKCGTVKWEMPHDFEKDPDAQFIVVADPGTKNPPYRDSAGISVWNITGFPAVPAQMVAFAWVAGNTSPHPWMNQYTDYVMRYRAIGRNAYDATGNGAAYAHLTDIVDLIPYPVNLGGGKKQAYLTLTQAVMNAGKIKMPYIEHLFSQLAKYDYAQDRAEKLRQDLVMMMLVLIAMLEQYWYTQYDNQEKKDRDYDPDDRYARPHNEEDRYGAHERDAA